MICGRCAIRRTGALQGTIQGCETISRVAKDSGDFCFEYRTHAKELVYG